MEKQSTFLAWLLIVGGYAGVVFGAYLRAPFVIGLAIVVFVIGLHELRATDEYNKE